jgi:hypothetical protein
MRQFPDEENRVEQVSNDLARKFEFAERIFGYWLETPKDKWLSKSSLPHNVKHVAMMLNVQAIRQFRSIVIECRNVEAISANIVARSLYETVVALLFILKPHVRIVTMPDTDKAGNQKKDSDGELKYIARPLRKKEKGKSPSRELRANLYLGKALVSAPRFFDRMGAIPGVKRFGKTKAAATRKLTAGLRKEYKQLVGQEWWSVLKHSSWYSGLGVEALTKLVDRSGTLDRWYQTIYRAQSDIAHAADAGIHAECTDNGILRPRFLSSNDEVCGALQEAVAFLLICINSCQKYIGFGAGVGMAVHGFLDEFHRVFLHSADRP